jgi:hypothetical protein
MRCTRWTWRAGARYRLNFTTRETVRELPDASATTACTRSFGALILFSAALPPVVSFTLVVRLPAAAKDTVALPTRRVPTLSLTRVTQASEQASANLRPFLVTPASVCLDTPTVRVGAEVSAAGAEVVPVLGAVLETVPVGGGGKYVGGGVEVVVVVPGWDVSCCVKVHERLAGDGSTLPSASIARTCHVCVPGPMIVLFGERQPRQMSLSSLHSKLPPGSVEVNVNEMSPDVTVAGGPDVMVVSGGVPSTVHVRDEGVVSVVPSASMARTSNVWDPSPSDA